MKSKILKIVTLSLLVLFASIYCAVEWTVDTHENREYFKKHIQYLSNNLKFQFTQVNLGVGIFGLSISIEDVQIADRYGRSLLTTEKLDFRLPYKEILGRFPHYQILIDGGELNFVSDERYVFSNLEALLEIPESSRIQSQFVQQPSSTVQNAILSVVRSGQFELSARDLSLQSGGKEIAKVGVFFSHHCLRDGLRTGILTVESPVLQLKKAELHGRCRSDSVAFDYDLHLEGVFELGSLSKKFTINSKIEKTDKNEITLKCNTCKLNDSDFGVEAKMAVQDLFSRKIDGVLTFGSASESVEALFEVLLVQGGIQSLLVHNHFKNKKYEPDGFKALRSEMDTLTNHLLREQLPFEIDSRFTELSVGDLDRMNLVWLVKNLQNTQFEEVIKLSSPTFDYHFSETQIKNNYSLKYKGRELPLEKPIFADLKDILPIDRGFLDFNLTLSGKGENGTVNYSGRGQFRGREVHFKKNPVHEFSDRDFFQFISSLTWQEGDITLLSPSFQAEKGSKLEKTNRKVSLRK